ncbi:MAG: NADH-quinone oxidoreductase subunit L [Methylococcus sp.]|nr:MAG: NADH-quinone oxidoreductase subunit L [Methylococcus sp.]
MMTPHEFLWLVPTFPFIGFLLLVLTSGQLPKKAVETIGVGSVFLSAVVTALIGFEFLGSSDSAMAMGAYRQTLWTWIEVGSFKSGFSLYLDHLSLTMLFVITGVGFLIHLYSAGFMEEDPGYSRFFSYMNLFVSSMLILVLGDNLVLLFLGWEGVGLCSYLLIGFWYRNADYGYAARKAFVVTRVGDTAMALGLFLLFTHLGTLEIQPLMQQAEAQWAVGSTMPAIAAALLLGGAVGKSAQLPLQVWLPDAMAGPTPISALIHAATMVTAGVYLIARTHVLFELAPTVHFAVAVIGALTLLISGFTALTQTDIKRILAYSTISQIGYMFLGLGVGAWSSAVFHLMTHAFFKALLFLGAGGVIYCFHHEHDIFKMGGLRKNLPVTFASFVIGGAALAALPFTSGHYSKDEILLAAFFHGEYGPWFWAAGLLGAFVTVVYTFRLIFIAFCGPSIHEATENFDNRMRVPLLILCVLALFGGMLQVPLGPVFDGVHGHPDMTGFEWVTAVTTAVPLIGLLVAYLFFLRGTFNAETITATAPGRFLQRFWFSGWGMDALYSFLFVKPINWLAEINKGDIVDGVYNGIAGLCRIGHQGMVWTQTGRIRWYAAGMILGSVALIGLGVAR